MNKKYNITFFRKLSGSTISIEIRILAKSITNAEEKACYKLDLLYGKEIFLRNKDDDPLLLRAYIVDIDILKKSDATSHNQNDYII